MFSALQRSRTASVTSGSAALASTRPIVKTKAQWRAAISQCPGAGKRLLPGFVSRAEVALSQVRDRAEDALGTGALPGARSARPGGPELAGDGTDYSAVVSGLISKGDRTFTNVSSGITEKGQIGGSGGQVRTPSRCSSTPSSSPAPRPAPARRSRQLPGLAAVRVHLRKQQFRRDLHAVLADQLQRQVPVRLVHVLEDCYTNSIATTVTTRDRHAARARVKLTGSAASGGNDSVSLSIGSGHATSVTNSDSKIDLATFWNTAEWGVYGDGGGSEANFGANTTLEAQTS